MVKERPKKRRRFQDVAEKINLDVLKLYFHLPLNEVAKYFFLCETFMKKICRFHGLNKWPYRNVRRLHNNVRKMVGRQDIASDVKNISGNIPARETHCDLKELVQLEESINGHVKKAAQTYPPKFRTAVWDTVKRRKLAGNSAPFTENLDTYLHHHQHCELYIGQDKLAKARKGSDPAAIAAETLGGMHRARDDSDSLHSIPPVEADPAVMAQFAIIEGAGSSPRRGIQRCVGDPLVDLFSSDTSELQESLLLLDNPEFFNDIEALMEM